jgi:hypothetical protein
MSGTGFYLDLSQFKQRFEKLANNDIPEAMRQGFFKAAATLLNDADNVVPKTPKKTGDLKGSKKIIVDRDEIVAGFNIVYAARVHEMLDNEQWGMVVRWSEPGSGAKYLESKLWTFGDKYIRIAIEALSGIR